VVVPRGRQTRRCSGPGGSWNRLATQTLVVFVIRTAGNPLKSRPSGQLLMSVLAVAVVGAVLPYTPLGPMLGFTAIATVVAGANCATGPDIPDSGAGVKTWFYRRHALALNGYHDGDLLNLYLILA